MANKVQELEIENKVLRDKTIQNQLTALGDTLHLELRNIRTELSQILEQAKKTNGRVTKSEEDIEVLKLKYQELLTTAININTLVKEQGETSSKLRNDLSTVLFLSKSPKFVWVLLFALYLVASNGGFVALIDLFR